MSEPHELAIERTIDAPREIVWRAVTEHLTEWWCPRPWRSEIVAVNDYNTYSMTGLPKGPIANPGKASIAAVLDPEANDYLYFVAKGDGGHAFARTLSEHNANVQKWYQLRRDRGEME